jgi:hypothetical protein
VITLCECSRGKLSAIGDGKNAGYITCGPHHLWATSHSLGRIASPRFTAARLFAERALRPIPLRAARDGAALITTSASLCCVFLDPEQRGSETVPCHLAYFFSFNSLASLICERIEQRSMHDWLGPGRDFGMRFGRRAERL